MPDSDGDEQETNSTNTCSAKNQSKHLQDKLAAQLSILPLTQLNKYITLHKTSPFWRRVYNHLHTNEENEDEKKNKEKEESTRQGHPALKSREWAEYIVNASQIFFDARLTINDVVDILNYIITYITFCILNCGRRRTIYFEGARDVFYDRASKGMTPTQEGKYRLFFGKMRASILGDDAQLDRGGDEIEGDVDVDEESISESGHESVEGHASGDTPSTSAASPTPAEHEISMLKAMDHDEGQSQPQQPSSKAERICRRNNLRRKERKNQKRKTRKNRARLREKLG